MNKKLVREAHEYSLSDSILVLSIVLRYVNAERAMEIVSANDRRSSGLYNRMVKELDHALLTGEELIE